MRIFSLALLCAGLLHADTALVLPFFNHAKSATLDWVGESIAQSVHDALASEGVLVLDREDRLEAYRRLSLRPGAELTHASILKIGESLDASQVIYGFYELLPAEAGDTCDGRTAANNATVRTVFVVGPDKKIKLMLSYPMSTGRNFDEVLRVVDSLQLTAKHAVSTPVNWKNGEDVIISGSVSDDDARKKYPQGWKSPKPYIRIIPQPK